MTQDFANKNKSKSSRKSGGTRSNSKKPAAKKTQAKKKPANKRNTRKNEKQGMSLPAWAFLLIGLFIGGFINGIYHLATMDVSEVQNSEVQDTDQAKKTEPQKDANTKTIKPSVKPSTEKAKTEKSKTDKTKTEQPKKTAQKPEKDQPKDFTYYESLKKATIDVPAEQLKPAPKSNIDYYLQTDSFKNRDDAERRRIELIMLNMDAHIHSVVAESGTTWHKVVAGPYKTRTSMSKARSTMADMNIKSIVHKRKSGKAF